MFKNIISWFISVMFVTCCKWARRNGGRLPFKAYVARVQTFPSFCIEIICVRQRADGKYEWLLERRPADDPYFAGQWCCQGGSVLGRQTLMDFTKMHAARECGIPMKKGEPELDFAGVAHLPLTEHEHAVSVIFVRWVKPTDGGRGCWLPIGSNLPEPFVPSMRGAMRVAEEFLRTRRPSWDEHLGP